MFALLQLGLQQEGFTVISAADGKEGLRRAYETRPDVVILDIMMPEMDGWLTCQRLRSMCDAPIIMLSARKDRSDILRGLYLGADDYLTKPCSFDELTARIRAVIRRANMGSRDTWRVVYDDDHLRVDIRDGTVKRDGKEIHLTPIESRLLSYLVSQKGRIVPHEELLMNVWGPEYTKEVDYLSVYIRYLRQKIEDDPADPRYIRTRWRKGYYFAGDGVFGPDDRDAEKDAE
jgi:two-component system KDP operon response regulator KdpE